MATTTRKKSNQEYAESANFKQTVKKMKMLQEYDMSDGPYDLSQRFKNL